MSDTLQKVGVYIDASNVLLNGGRDLQYNVLREFVTCDGSIAMRLNTYVAVDSDDSRKKKAFLSVVRERGFKVVEKPVKWFTDEDGSQTRKANADLDMAVDALLQSERLDRVVFVTGDGDFVKVIQAIQNKGCRVEVIGLHNVAKDLRNAADFYMSGFLVPNLVPVNGQGGKPEWGEIGSRVRGVCYNYDATRGFGYVRYMHDISPTMWQTDTRHEDSPYKSVFMHRSELSEEIQARLPRHDMVLEFTLADPFEKGDLPRAVDVSLMDT